uniref:Uncharacterized protein n=1 Tax=Heterorhabditis bacteriophora TaxID=37862 RepID=A0A1I7WDJ9_HETBA
MVGSGREVLFLFLYFIRILNTFFSGGSTNT